MDSRDHLFRIFHLYRQQCCYSRAISRRCLRAVCRTGIESGAVISFFSLCIGTEFNFFNDLLYGRSSRADTTALTVAESGELKHVARSAGTITHPSQAAYYFEFILPIVLGCLVAARRISDRILFGAIFGIGFVALVMTFSRSGMLGFLVMSAIFFSV